MSEQTNIRIAFYKQWFRDHSDQMQIWAAVTLGCIVAGLVFLNPVEKLGYERGEVVSYGIRHGSNRPGVRIQVRLQSGEIVYFDSRAANAKLEKGIDLCLIKTKGKIYGTVRYAEALPSRCTTG